MLKTAMASNAEPETPLCVFLVLAGVAVSERFSFELCLCGALMDDVEVHADVCVVICVCRKVIRRIRQ